MKRWNAVQKPVELIDVDPEHFNEYLAYIYSRDAIADIQNDDNFSLCTRLYVLADRLGDCDTANDSILWIIDEIDDGDASPSWGCVKTILDAVSSDSPLHRLLVDFYVHAATSEHMEELWSDEANQLALSFGFAIGKRHREREATAVYGDTVWEIFHCKLSRLPRDRYHQHNDSHPKDKCMDCMDT